VKSTLMTPSEVQGEFRLGRDTLRRLVKNGSIPFIQIGPRKFLFSKPALVEVFKFNATTSYKRKADLLKRTRLRSTRAKRHSHYKFTERLKRYGINEAYFDNLMKIQDNACAICRRPFPLAKEARPVINVDHDHLTGQVRGLLCTRCNHGIGLLGDSVKMLKDAIAYLGKVRAASELENLKKGREK